MKRIVSIALAVLVLSCSVSFADNSESKGIDIAQYITRYYARKMNICDIVKEEFEFGRNDRKTTGNMYYVDGIIVEVSDDGYVYQVMIRESELPNLVRSIPVIYALRDDLYLDAANDAKLQYGFTANGYWLVDYKDDFELFKSATIRNPATWGDYNAFMFSSDDGTGASTSVIVFTIKK